MVGAIIGDLAAWTWEHDKNAFLKKLITPEAAPSPYREEMLLTANLLMRQRDMSYKEYSCHFKNRNPTATVLRAIAIGWLYETELETRSAYQNYCLYDDKEDWYAGAFMSLLIFALRHGASKKEAATVKHIAPFKDMIGDWKDKDSILGTLMRAWEAFRSSFDFGSALHNAMLLPGDCHVNAIFVGALADAMYGCDRYFVKNKYGEGCALNSYKYVSEEIMQLHRRQRTFFPKNCAATNIEKHQWHEAFNPYKDKVVTPELRRRILKAFQPCFDYRFGFYLDDGFVYVYRSGWVLQRFNLVNQGDGTYRITNLQSAECVSKSDNPISEALYAVEFRWDLVNEDKNDSESSHKVSNRQAFFGISRHRIGIDGNGVTTLVTFMECPFKCKYCLNERCHKPIFKEDGTTPNEGIMLLTPQELYDKVKIDNIYFQATEGGICFGGGEPLLHSDFIKEFRDICGSKWKITVETALVCSWADINLLASIVDHWIVDIKDMNSSIKSEYTGMSESSLVSLNHLKGNGITQNVTVKVPHIPEYNTDKDVAKSIEQIKGLGFKDIVECQYIKFNGNNKK